MGGDRHFEEQKQYTNLMSCLHFVDNAAVNAQSRRADVYWQVRPVINRINDATEQAYIPEQYCCVDEKRYGYIAVHNNFIKYLYVLLPV